MLKFSKAVVALAHYLFVYQPPLNGVAIQLSNAIVNTICMLQKHTCTASK